MWGKRIRDFLLFSALIFMASGCIFKSSPNQGVMSYRNERVYIQNKRFYRVGDLPAGWERMNTKARTISFYHPGFKSSISTDAFCGRSVGERKLESLGGDIISAIENRTLISEKEFQLNNRGAIRQYFKGAMDGVTVNVDLVVIRKDGCVFDFYAVTPPDPDEGVARDFEGFFSGFSYE